MPPEERCRECRGNFDEAINQALDAYELMRRKALAWDDLIKALAEFGELLPGVVDEIERLRGL